MSMRVFGLTALLLAVGGLGFADRAQAGIGGKIAKDLAAGAVEGAVEKLEPALGRTLADVDSRLAAHEERIGNVVGGLVGQTSTEIGARLGQVDGILEKRLLQVQLGVDEVLDHGLDKIDGVARARLAQVDDTLAARIKQVDGVVAKTLSQADELLKNRVADVGKVVTGAIDRADGALGERIEQLDEVAGKRLGNVDVIATKQRLGLDQRHRLPAASLEALHQIAHLQQRRGHAGVPIASSRMQRAAWPAPSGSGGGGAARHASMTQAQRSANGQPGGKSINSGTRPGIVASRGLRPSTRGSPSRGRAAKRPRV